MKKLLCIMLLSFFVTQILAQEAAPASLKVAVALTGDTHHSGISLEIAEVWYQSETGELKVVVQSVLDYGNFKELDEQQQLTTRPLSITVNKHSQTSYILTDGYDSIDDTDKECTTYAIHGVYHNEMSGFEKIWQRHVDLILPGNHLLEVKRDNINLKKMSINIQLYRMGYGRSIFAKTNSKGELLEVGIHEGGVYPDAIWTRLTIPIIQGESTRTGFLMKTKTLKKHQRRPTTVEIVPNQYGKLLGIVEQIVSQSSTRVVELSDELQKILSETITHTQIEALYKLKK